MEEKIKAVSNVVAIPLRDEDIEHLDSYQSQVVVHYAREFQKAKDRFPTGDQLIERFIRAVGQVKVQGRAYFHAVDDNHNELCVAHSLLESSAASLSLLEYEPALPNTDRTIDFVATLDKGKKLYVDVKTVRPKLTSRWGQFLKLRDSGKLSPNTSIVLDEKWAGGEIWHGWFASRGRMLDYSLELEEKIRLAGLASPNSASTLAFCGEGYGWEEDQLEDFVAYYRTGRHRADDAFATMEAHYIEENDIKLDRTISTFAAMRRPQFVVQRDRFNWNVLPPRDGL